MENELYERALLDELRNWLEKIGYSTRISQKFFGNFPNMNQFIELTQEEITIKPHLAKVAPITASRFSFEITIEYKADSNGKYTPIFKKQIRHTETIKRITYDEYKEMSSDQLNAYFIILGQGKVINIKMKYHRNSKIELL